MNQTEETGQAPENLSAIAKLEQFVNEEQERQRLARIDQYKRTIDGLMNEGELDSLFSVGNLINAINNENGWKLTKPDDWHYEYKVPAILGLIHSEVSEALEAFRKQDKANFAEECADVFIRLLDMTNAMEIDLPSAVFAKLRKNCDRGFRHGGKKV